MAEYDDKLAEKGEVLSTGLKAPSSNFSIVKCPFCKQSVKAFWWSLAGSGKKCGCGAKFHSNVMFKPPVGKVYDPARLKFVAPKPRRRE